MDVHNLECACLDAELFLLVLWIWSEEPFWNLPGLLSFICEYSFSDVGGCSFLNWTK